MSDGNARTEFPSLVERVAREVCGATNIEHCCGKCAGPVALARRVIGLLRVTDADVMAHPWMTSDQQDVINAYIDAALAEGGRG